MRNKVDTLDVDKLVPVPVDFSKLSVAAKNDVVKKDVYNTNIKKNNEDKIPDITNLTTNINLNAKINENKNEIPSITNLANTTFLNAKKVQNRIPNITNLAAINSFTAVENKIPNHDKYITTPEFNKLTADTLLQD